MIQTCSLPHRRHLSQPTQSMMRDMLRNFCLKASCNGTCMRDTVTIIYACTCMWDTDYSSMHVHVFETLWLSYMYVHVCETLWLSYMHVHVCETLWLSYIHVHVCETLWLSYIHVHLSLFTQVYAPFYQYAIIENKNCHVYMYMQVFFTEHSQSGGRKVTINEFSRSLLCGFHESKQI